MSCSDDLVTLFQTGLGLSEAKAKETAKNTALSANLKTALDSSAGSDLAGKGSLLYTAASKVKPQTATHLPLLAKMIAAGKLDSEVRVQAGLDYLLQHSSHVQNKNRTVRGGRPSDTKRLGRNKT